MFRLGIDVGGTFTDAVLFRNSKLVSWSKERTTGDILTGLVKVLDHVIDQGARACGMEIKVIEEGIDTVFLSTTVLTNLIVEYKEDPVDLYIIPGPGMNVANRLPTVPIVLEGYVDHRGFVKQPIQKEEVIQALDKRINQACAISGKFGVRNDALEEMVKDVAIQKGYETISVGHHFGGTLNFPRRTVSAYFNSAVTKPFTKWTKVMEDVLESRRIRGKVHILKADGGTFKITDALKMPVESIYTGPAATIRGIQALKAVPMGHVVALDIGGTTTDISLWIDGEPLKSQRGLCIREFPSSIQSFELQSVGIGGESLVTYERGRICVGPIKKGPSLALGGKELTLGDALVLLGAVNFGDVRLAEAGMLDFKERIQFKGTIYELCHEIVEHAIDVVEEAIHGLVEMVNVRPTYVVDDVVHGDLFAATSLCIVGGSAEGLGPFLEKRMHMPVYIPKGAEVANAIGAALTRDTKDITVYIDTAETYCIIPELDYKDRKCMITTVDEAKELGVRKLSEVIESIDYAKYTEHAEHVEHAEYAEHTETVESRKVEEIKRAEIDVIYEEILPVLHGWGRKDYMITVKLQSRGGVQTYVEWKE